MGSSVVAGQLKRLHKLEGRLERLALGGGPVLARDLAVCMTVPVDGSLDRASQAVPISALVISMTILFASWSTSANLSNAGPLSWFLDDRVCNRASRGLSARFMILPSK